jgi:hypothetical protein
MTAEYIVDFVKRTGFNFEHMLNDPYWFINDELSKDDKEVFDLLVNFKFLMKKSSLMIKDSQSQ